MLILAQKIGFYALDLVKTRFKGIVIIWGDDVYAIVYESLKKSNNYGHNMDTWSSQCGHKRMIGPKFPSAQNRMSSTIFFEEPFLNNHYEYTNWKKLVPTLADGSCTQLYPPPRLKR